MTWRDARDKQLRPLDALKIQNSDIVDYLEGLPEQKIHCSVMGEEALGSAVFNWAQRRGVDLEALGIDIHTEEQEEGRIVCKCFSLSEPYLRRKIKELNLRTIPEITNAVKAGGACMSCHHVPGGLQDLLDEIWGTADEEKDGQTLRIVPKLDQPGQPVELGPAASGPQPELSPYQFAKKVERVMEEYICPMIRRDGGDVELVDIKETLVYCRLGGACAGCANANLTLKMMIEKTLKDRIDERIRVIAV